MEVNVNMSKAYHLALPLLLVPALCYGQVPGHVATSPDEVKWGPASPKLPPGAQFAVIAGDPSKPGVPYVFRAKSPDGYSVPRKRDARH